jgi:hypothetical protein
MRREAVVVLVGLLSACSSPPPFSCSTNSNCNKHANGLCVSSTNYCAYPDTTCTSGYRYDDESGGTYGGMCLPLGDGNVQRDAAADGSRDMKSPDMRRDMGPPPDTTFGGWPTQTSGTTNELRRIWVSPTTGDAYIVGNGGTILHRPPAGAWAAQSSGTTLNLFGIWGSSSGDLYATGDNGTILYSTISSGTWAKQTSPCTVQILTAVWGSSPTDVYIVGGYGAVLHSGGGPAASWTKMGAGTTMYLEDIWGSGASNIYVVGDHPPVAGTTSYVLHWKGTSWSPENAAGSTMDNFYSVWGTSSGGDVYIVGQNGDLEHSSGSGIWTTLSSGVSVDLRGVSGTSASDLYAVGSGGTIIHSTGGVWGAITPSGTTNDLFDVNASATAVLAVGSAGTILQGP